MYSLRSLALAHWFDDYFVRMFVHSCVRVILHSSVRSIRPSVRPSLPAFMRSFVHSYLRSFVHSLMHVLVCSLVFRSCACLLACWIVGLGLFACFCFRVRPDNVDIRDKEKREDLRYLS